jgi:HSP20 family protein
MSKKSSKEEAERRPEIDLGLGGKGLLGGFFKGLSSLIDLADKVTQEGGKVEKSGEFTVKGAKDVTGVYGFSVRTMAGPGGIARPVVRPFGDISKLRVEKEARPKGPIVEETREPFVDLFDEGGFIRLVAEMPGVAEANLVCEIQGDDVLQLSTTGKKKYSKELLLPAKVDPGSLVKNYTNGVLEIQLRKK